MLSNLIKLGVLAGAGYAAWKAFGRSNPRPFFEQALQAGAADAEAARSAQLRGASASVRSFAQQLEREHGQHNSRLAEASGSQVPQPDGRQRAKLHKLDLHQGEAYDRAWLRHMAQSHHESIRLYQNEVDRSGPGAAIAADALPDLRAHARRLAELQAEMTGSAEAAGKTGQGVAAGPAMPSGPQATM